MRWLIAADLHLRPETWARLPQLRGDAYESLKQIVKIAFHHEVSGVLLLGDVFDAAYPDALSVRALADAARQFNVPSGGIPFLILQGNHDAVSVRAADQSPTSWASAVAATWAHKKVIPLGAHTGYALDYTPPGQLAAALAEIPPACDVLFAHQSWAELQRIGHTDGNAAMLPPHIRHIFTGDNHKRMTVVVPGPAELVTFYSPGSTTMQAMNESPDKFVDIVDFHFAEPRITPVKLVTRPFVQLEFSVPGVFDSYVASPRAHVLAYEEGAQPPVLPAAIASPLVHAKVSDSIPDYKARLRAAITCDCHIDCVPLPAVLTEVEIDFEASAVEGGFETLTSAVQTLAARDGSPPGVVEDVIALLRSNDRNVALGEIRKKFLERLSHDSALGATSP